MPSWGIKRHRHSEPPETSSVLAVGATSGTQVESESKECLKFLETVSLLIIDDLGTRKLPLTAAEELLEVVMGRYERVSTLLTSNRPFEDWAKLLGDAAVVSAMLDRLLHHEAPAQVWTAKLEDQTRCAGAIGQRRAFRSCSAADCWRDGTYRNRTAALSEGS